MLQVGLKSEDMRRPAILGLEAMLVTVCQPEEFARELAHSRDAVTGRIEQLITGAQAAGELDPALDARALTLQSQVVVIGLLVPALDREQTAPVVPVLRLIGRILEGLASPIGSRPGSEC